MNDINFNTIYEVLNIISDRKLPPVTTTSDDIKLSKSILFNLLVILIFIYLTSALLGYSIHTLIIQFPLIPKLIPVLQYSNRWHLLSITSKEDNTVFRKHKPIILLRVLVQGNNSNILYTGTLEEFCSDDSGKLDFIMLKQLGSFTPLQLQKQMNGSQQITEEIIIIKYSDILHLHMTYFQTEHEMTKKDDTVNKVIITSIILSGIIFGLFPFFKVEFLPELNDRIIFSIISLLNIISILRYIQGIYGTIMLNEETPSAGFTISAILFLSVYYLKIFTDISIWVLLLLYFITTVLLIGSYRRMKKPGDRTEREIKISKKIKTTAEKRSAN
ncbi:hypothetical protein [Gynurincola endophyticus]|uniref:hypothetical protein n=1 Tax=Gynurincola endophyticus TaxID=2479004 RepID=UPI000F8CEB47|nr:hypothetical protein [Gynurincola endophyticus]